jgi:hypothetical protein
MSDEAAYLSAAYVKGQVVDGAFIAVGFREVVNFQHRFSP